ncbi:MAG: o-succinylbenzoate synthase [Synechococcales bacterium]|nr:o-succinylbenzoate synthase [Synechococcales bacterium]
MVDVYRVEYRVYGRPLRRSLVTHHGTWRVRRGIIVRLIDAEGRWGLGEIAPLPDFGSETLEAAIAFCQSLPARISGEAIGAIPATLPATQFGFESALAMQHSPRPEVSQIDFPAGAIAYLLPTGKAALTHWQTAWEGGSRTMKWKIGVTEMEQELRWLADLVEQLPANVRLRLDANGGLTKDQAQRWLAACDAYSAAHAQIEFLEQPLPPAQFDLMLTLSQRYRTPVALDESVANLQQLQKCYERGWRGPVVIKAAIAGFPSQLLTFCRTHAVDVVWSSVLETAIAQRYIFDHLMPALPQCRRAIGFGVNHWFAPSALDVYPAAADELWERLSA